MKQKSSDQLFESLSALVDGEASELELHRILKSIGEDEALQARWQRYHLMRSVLRKDSMPLVGSHQADFLNSVRSAIDSEVLGEGGEGPLSSQSSGDASNARSKMGGVWAQWIGKSAVAASVAFVFVLGFSQLQNSHVDQTAVLAEVVNYQDQNAGGTQAAPLGFELPAVESRTVSVAQQVRNYSPASAVVANPLLEQQLSTMPPQVLLNQLHILHAERASVNGSMSLLPFARVSEMTLPETEANP